MPNNRVKKAESLFSAYTKNLSFYHPQLAGVFLCPICLQPFTRDAVLSGELTLEHIIPSSLGGKILSLTCAECNSKAGTQLDAHLVQRIRIEDILSGKSDKPLKARVKIGNGEFGADIYLSENQDPNIRIVGIPSISSPELHALASLEIESGVKSFSLHGSLGYKDVPSRVAVLRAAYLLMFRYFGYGYILYRNLKQIRSQILQPEVETSPIKAIYLIDEMPLTNIIALLKQPDDLRCFLAIINISTNIKRNIAVVLPGPDPKSETIYERWIKASISGQINYRPDIDVLFYNPAYISESEHKFLPEKLWKGHVIIRNDETKNS